MLELRLQARLAQEARARLSGGGERRVQELERDDAVERAVAGEHDDAHPAASKLAHELIARAERLGPGPEHRVEPRAIRLGLGDGHTGARRAGGARAREGGGDGGGAHGRVRVARR
jgi:hypothetical protein